MQEIALQQVRLTKEQVRAMTSSMRVPVYTPSRVPKEEEKPKQETTKWREDRERRMEQYALIEAYLKTRKGDWLKGAEIAKHIGLSSSSVTGCLTGMKKAGMMLEKRSTGSSVEWLWKGASA